MKVLVYGWAGAEREQMIALGFKPQSGTLGYEAVEAEHPMDVAREIYDGGLAVTVWKTGSGGVVVFVDTHNGAFHTR